MTIKRIEKKNYSENVSISMYFPLLLFQKQDRICNNVVPYVILHFSLL